MTALEVEPDGSNDFGPCECCDSMSRTIWGYVHQGDCPYAVYYVHWTLGQVEKDGAHVDLIIGGFGENATPDDRYLISLEYRIFDSGPSFMVIDSGQRKAADPDFVSTFLSRDEVIGTPKAQEAFDIIDAIWLQDERISELDPDGW